MTDLATECWPYRGTIDSHGYGVQKIGHVIDHLCFQRSCVNPDHLRAVAPEINAARKSPEALRSASEKLRAYHARRRAGRVYCANGHNWKVEAVRQADGRHYCKACKREQSRRRRAYAKVRYA